jgi:hypothetical protein
LPEDVWLNRFQANADGSVTLAGTSYGDEGTFEFVRWLSSVPGCSDAQLDGMQTQRLATGLATRFDVKFDFDGGTALAGKVESDD